ncbi:MULTISPECIES: CusA/CzcA family heavy metal efflux RND transporter [unclassified Arcicella]|uniref:efflux RND transporter permease subunit n=1 Tax=unclassified Arcicella TaxID=2644986 RepID=UPI0028606338|nr:MULTISPECIES: CusA/CzcA family heavy metal efflux RND transporter [unclassified Arcicella]MDR6563994.1 cobalt-zinc-cadmium resistance protein CzcA [Arcicella sp. BE51]MDR6813747.1 cobalt-zinc-cadmium resistance protein CzcA [Arcicella sp. BE140]MDR6825059.1 cobalt-zinc-cadmium resistance protein CzcA [Arcicella sp. BE139]
MKTLLALSLKFKFAVFFFTAVIVVGGIFSFLNTPIDAFPDVTNTQVTIITQWPGRSAEEIEKFVTAPLEISMNGVQKKTTVRSTTLFGLSVVVVMFDDGVDNNFARIQINNALQGLSLPDDVEPEIQPPYGPTGEIFRYTLDSKSLSARKLKEIQDWVVDRNLRSVPGVADIVSFGGEVKTYEISVNPNLLQAYNITPLDVFQAVQKSNINVGGDVITKNNQAYVVRGIGLLANISDIENILVENIDGVPVYVKTVATVSESALPKLGQVGRGNNNDAVEGIVVMRKGEDPSAVIKSLNDKVEELNTKILPVDVNIKTFYNRQTLLDFCIETVSHNLLEGIVLVTLMVLIFLADWRASLIVAMIIPLALLFAFTCLKLMGMSVNLLSLGAVDFGIIIDGTVVVVEGLIVVLSHKAHEVGMERFNKLAKLSLIKRTGTSMGKAIFTSKVIILVALLPIFAFQKVEGKMFTPLAWTLGAALLGALIFTLTLVPVMVSILMDKNVKEKSNFFVDGVLKYSMMLFNYCFSHKRGTFITTAIITVVGLWTLTIHGTEFLPQLNEGSIYVRATMPRSISLNESVRYANDMRKVFESFPEVRQVMSQAGRPNDGTDPTGFYNVEFHVDIYPQKEWKSHLTKAQLIEQMQKKLDVFQGVSLGFSQPIMDNVEEAVSGVKGSIAVKIYGQDFEFLEKQAEKVNDVLKKIKGIEDLGIIKNLGQPELRIELDQQKMDLYGVQAADAEAVVSMAIGGQTASQLFEGERKFDIRIRFQSEYRKSEAEIGDLMVPTMNGTKIPIKEIAVIRTLTGPSLIFREDTKRFIAVKFSVRGRDMGSTIEEAQTEVNKVIHALPKGYEMKWKGDFENQQRASKRLAQVVPISMITIFFILYLMFGSLKDAGLVFTNVPFAIIGGSLALLVTGTNFSISAGIGFIALFGICIQNGVIMIEVFKDNLHRKLSLHESILQGVQSRVRPVMMTALMGIFGMLPAAVSSGIGSESQKPLAIVVIGGLVGATVLTLFIFPLFYERVYRNK